MINELDNKILVILKISLGALNPIWDSRIHLSSYLFQIQLKFSAPPKVGNYQYTVILRSDSYFDFDLHHNFKVSTGT